MRASRWQAAWLAAAAGSALAAGEAPADAARVFLARHAQLAAAADTAVLALYRDDARVRVATVAGGREVAAVIVPGAAWTARLRAGWFEGTSRLEASDFVDAAVTVQGARLVIRARRYSATRCYWDDAYAVAIEPDARGAWRIVEERLAFQPLATCPAPGAVAPLAAPAATVAASPALPTALLPANAAPSGHRPPGRGAP